MSKSNIFLQASRLKLRFASPVGSLTVEDLWNIPLKSQRTNKASIENVGAAVLTRQTELAKVGAASIFEDSDPSPELAQVNLQVAILREVASIRQAENKAKTESAARQSERERLEALIKEREGKELPLDDLKARLAALN